MIMHFHTGNVYFGIFLAVHISIFLTKKQIKNMKKKHPQLDFIFITSLHVVIIMVELHLQTKKYVTCVKNNIHQINIKYIQQKRASDDGDNNILFSYQLIHSNHTKICFLYTKCAHTWYKSLWCNATHSLQKT